MTPIADPNSERPEPDPPADDEPQLEVDSTALHALVRELTATHLFVWTMNASSVLQSTKIPITDIAQRVSDARRIMVRDPEQALQMVRGASAGFDTAAQRWDAQVRQSELHIRASRKPGKLSQVVSKHNQIRTRVAPVKSVFRRALSVLQEAEARAQQSSSDPRSTETDPAES